MRRSIRRRLQVWYGLVLLGVVAGFAGLLYFRVRAARLREIDSWLEGAALYLDSGLRPLPPPELEGFAPPQPRPRPPGRRDGPGPPLRRRPPPPDINRLMEELDLPDRPSQPGKGGPSARSYFAVWRHDGSSLKARGLPPDLTPPDDPEAFPSSRPRVRERGEFREALLRGPHATRILVGRSIGKELGDLHALGWQLAGAGALVLAVGLAGGWLVSARILRPVAAISATASAISARNLSERIDSGKVDRELEGLAGVLNAMFDRLEAAFERQARFTADASHELRTPLAIIRSHAELALARPRSPEEYREALEACLRASGRMGALVEGLLTLARADAGKLDLRRQRVDLKQIVEENLALFRPLAEGKGITVAVRLTRGSVTGDPMRLGQVVTNLLSNAVQYNRPGGTIDVEVRTTPGEVALSMRDTGCGIPVADRPYLFERFYRVDKARSRDSGGNGLGLAICKSIVEAHGGTIGFETEPGRGSTFWVRLPAAAEENFPS